MVRLYPDNPLSGGVTALHIYLHMEANYRSGALLTNQFHCYAFLLTNITLKTGYESVPDMVSWWDSPLIHTNIPESLLK